MSLTSRGARRSALAGALALTALSASSAQAAQTATLNYKCKFPIIGTQPLALEVTLDIPNTWPIDVPTPAFEVTAKASAGGSTSQGLVLIEGLRTIGGVTELEQPGKGTAARATVEFPDGTNVVVRVPIDIEPLTVTPPLPSPLVLLAKGKTPSLTFEAPGTAAIKMTQLLLNLKGLDANGEPVEGLVTPTKTIEGAAYADVDGEVGTFNVPCTLDAGQNTQLASLTVTAPGTQDLIPPTVPGTENLPYVPADFTPTSVNLRWGASTDEPGGSGLKEYIVEYPGAPAGGIHVPAGQLSKLITGLGGGCNPAPQEIVFTVKAVDNVGNVSEPSEQVVFTLGGPIPNAVPSKPNQLTGTSTKNSVSLSWQAPLPVPCGPIFTSYNVYRDSVKVAAVTGTAATITGLNPSTVYSFTVEAIDNFGGASLRSDAFSIPTKPDGVTPPVHFDYSLKGSTTIKTLSKGTLPLTGGIAADLTLATGAFSADLTLADTSGKLTALGFLPVSAKIGFVPSGKTTGSLIEGVLKTSSKVRIKVKEVKLFGAIPLAGGNNCQTKNLSDINLQSTQAEFAPLTGGPIAGTFTISDLNGCGVLNGLVSPLTAGAGNTINLNLTPKP